MRGIRAMDGAAEPTRTYLRRPRHPTPPRHPTDSPLLLLLLLLLLPLIRQVQGAALPANLTPTPAPSTRPAHAA
ncbi:hypothetical protein CR919_11730 [Stenotrophomonas sp. LMG 10879]|nr:hypothetical protein CR919_11730 [Stenotrophomonas sp. LMG 10879]